MKKNKPDDTDHPRDNCVPVYGEDAEGHMKRGFDCALINGQSLTGRLADVYEALLVKYAGGQEKITFTALARKWGVSVTQIGLDRDKIFRMIRETVEAGREE